MTLGHALLSGRRDLLSGRRKTEGKQILGRQRALFLQFPELSCGKGIRQLLATC